MSITVWILMLERVRGTKRFEGLERTAGATGLRVARLRPGRLF